MGSFSALHTLSTTYTTTVLREALCRAINQIKVYITNSQYTSTSEQASRRLLGKQQASQYERTAAAQTRSLHWTTTIGRAAECRCLVVVSSSTVLAPLTIVSPTGVGEIVPQIRTVREQPRPETRNVRSRQ